MAQRNGRRGSLMCSGWNLLFVHVADLEKRCVEHQKRFASPFICLVKDLENAGFYRAYGRP
jgi:hypothetical protein